MSDGDPDGWSALPGAGLGLIRELWVASAAEALAINAALAMVPRVADLVRSEARIAELEARVAELEAEDYRARAEGGAT